MKKLPVVSVVTLLYVLCTGYSDLTTAVCAPASGNDVLRRCGVTTPPGTVITPAENIYAYASGQSRLYRSGNSPAYTIVTGGGRRIMHR